MSTRSTDAGCFAAKAALVPLWPVVNHECKLGSENPPLAYEGQVATLHIGEGDVLAFCDFASVLGEAASERALALGRSFGSLTDVHEPTIEVESVDAARFRPNAFSKTEHRA